CAATPVAPATSSTSGTGSPPTSIPGSWPRSSPSSTPKAGPMADGRLGVVVMAYGTPATPDDIEGYYTHIRRGNAPTPEQLAGLTARYAAIGGISPLAERTEAQRAQLERALEAAAPGFGRVVLGQKHAAPFIE